MKQRGHVAEKASVFIRAESFSHGLDAERQGGRGNDTVRKRLEKFAAKPTALGYHRSGHDAI